MDSVESFVRQRASGLLAAARRVLADENEAREVVDAAAHAARDLLPLFRADSPGIWIQGLVVGLALARNEMGRRGVGRVAPRVLSQSAPS